MTTFTESVRKLKFFMQIFVRKRTRAVFEAHRFQKRCTLGGLRRGRCNWRVLHRCRIESQFVHRPLVCVSYLSVFMAFITQDSRQGWLRFKSGFQAIPRRDFGTVLGERVCLSSSMMMYCIDLRISLRFSASSVSSRAPANESNFSIKVLNSFPVASMVQTGYTRATPAWNTEVPVVTSV